MTETSVKSLAKVFNSSLRDSDTILQTKADLTAWLTAIDKSGLPGKFKAWIYQHGVLPRLLWPLLVYELSISTVEILEQNISRFLRRWLGLPQFPSSIALYGHSTKMQLPISSLSEELMVTRTRELIMFRDSSEMKVATGIQVKTGRMWKAQDGVDRASCGIMPKSENSPGQSSGNSNPSTIKFLIQSVYNVLPSPSNLQRWG